MIKFRDRIKKKLNITAQKPYFNYLHGSTAQNLETIGKKFTQAEIKKTSILRLKNPISTTCMDRRPLFRHHAGSPLFQI